MNKKNITNPFENDSDIVQANSPEDAISSGLKEAKRVESNLNKEANSGWLSRIVRGSPNAELIDSYEKQIVKSVLGVRKDAVNASLNAAFMRHTSKIEAYITREHAQLIEDNGARQTAGLLNLSRKLEQQSASLADEVSKQMGELERLPNSAARSLLERAIERKVLAFDRLCDSLIKQYEEVYKIKQDRFFES